MLFIVNIDATDEDIGSILEEMSKLTGVMSPIPESIKSKSNEILSEGSVEELIQEAEKLVKQNTKNTRKAVAKPELIVLDDSTAVDDDLTRVRQLEVDIFKMIEDQVNEESKPKRRSLSPSVEVLFENLNSQKKKFDEQKVEVSSNSDLDDPIERHSVSEDVDEQKKLKDKKDSLKKEITDVDKDFFDALIKKTKESADQLSSRSSSFDQEDYSHFLKLLQEQSDKEQKSKKEDRASRNSSLHLLIDQFDPLKEKSDKEEKDKKAVLDLESPVCPAVLLLEQSSARSQHSSRDSSKRSSISAKSPAVDTKRVVNHKNELYTVGLTPRLELFADAIPKLLAEKTSNETKRSNEEDNNETTPKSDDNEDFSFKNLKALDVFKHTDILDDHRNVTDVKDFTNSQAAGLDYNGHTRTERVISAPEAAAARNTRSESYMGKSRSYDQLSKVGSRLGTSHSSENLKNAGRGLDGGRKQQQQQQVVMAKKAMQQPQVPKMKIQARTTTASKFNPRSKAAGAKSKKEPLKRECILVVMIVFN